MKPPSFIARNVRLKDYTTFRIGGNAEYFAEIRSVQELSAALGFCKDVTVLGRGSNVLVSSRGVAGLTLRMQVGGIAVDNGTAVAGAGVSLPALAAFCRENGFAGFAFAHGIPGSVGGAVKMNAGAFKACIADRLVWCEILRAGKIVRLTAAECGFSYRNSGLLPSDIVVRAAFGVSEADRKEIADLERQYAAYRRATQPSGASAGSVFKAAEAAAGWYIDRAGLKGLRIGDAEISSKHANFILNTGNASSDDVIALVKRIKQEVFGQFGVVLEEEIRYVGAF